VSKSFLVLLLPGYEVAGTGDPLAALEYHHSQAMLVEDIISRAELPMLEPLWTCAVCLVIESESVGVVCCVLFSVVCEVM
jgi:hypothetical protein